MTPRRLVLAVAVLALLAPAFASKGAFVGLAYLLPALLLIGVLLVFRYPGERRLLAAVQTRRRRRADSVVHDPRPRALLARGGRLIASSLAVRPPPTVGLLAIS